MRLMENAAPGHNGGGWIDLGGSSDNLSRFLEQAEFSILGGAKELTLFNFPSLLSSPVLSALDPALRRVDAFLDHAGSPTGTAVWEPFDGEGEDQLISYLGMCGAALEPWADFPENASAILFTQRSACQADAMKKLEAYVRNGGKAIVTTGFLRQVYHQGIQDMTSVRLTCRHATGSNYMIDRCDFDYAAIRYAQGNKPILLEQLDYKTNATWADVLLLSEENNYPLLTEDFYGRGRLLILNVPENFADLYHLPAEILGVLCGELATGKGCFLASEPKMSLITFDNDTCCLHSFRPMLSRARLVVRGECSGLQDLETGAVYRDPVRLPAPHHRGDAARTRPAPPEYAFDLPIGPGRSLFLQILR